MIKSWKFLSIAAEDWDTLGELLPKRTFTLQRKLIYFRKCCILLETLDSQVCLLTS
jgi:hypothetical protein